MAFKKKITFGKTQIEGVARLRNFRMGSLKSPITCELHSIPDLETYKEIKDQERGYLINEDGTPKLNAEGRKIGVIAKLDINESTKVKQLNSRDLLTSEKIEYDSELDPEKKKAILAKRAEKDLEFRNKLAKLCYEYFGEGEEI